MGADPEGARGVKTTGKSHCAWFEEDSLVCISRTVSAEFTGRPGWGSGSRTEAVEQDVVHLLVHPREAATGATAVFSAGAALAKTERATCRSAKEIRNDGVGYK